MKNCVRQLEFTFRGEKENEDLRLVEISERYRLSNSQTFLDTHRDEMDMEKLRKTYTAGSGNSQVFFWRLKGLSLLERIGVSPTGEASVDQAPYHKTTNKLTSMYPYDETTEATLNDGFAAALPRDKVGQEKLGPLSFTGLVWGCPNGPFALGSPPANDWLENCNAYERARHEAHGEHGPGASW